MKKYALIITGTLLSLITVISSCKKKEDPLPCDNKGNLCFENKMDTTVTISLKPANIQFTLQKDYILCNELIGNQPYTITIATPSSSRDTTVFILPCDNTLLILK